MHRATHGAARRAVRERRSVSARIVVLAILSPALLLIGSTAADAAIVKGFSPVFSTNTNGQIILRGNTNETCNTVYTAYSPNPPAPPAGSTACAEAQKGGDGYNNQFLSRYTDVDGVASTFNSSSATIDVPAGSRVLYARLSWSGSRTGNNAPTNSAPDAAKSNQVKLQGPGATGYTTVTSTDPVSVGDTSYDAYGASADVTSYVAARGAGSYTVADIQAGLGNDRYAGWSMAVAYSNPSEPVRNLTIFDGWGTVRQNQTLDIPVSGFQTPPNGAVDTRVGVAAFEGDRGLTGDQLSLDTGGGTFAKLSNAVNPEGNSFNSTVSQTGVAVAGRNPSYDNTMGVDVDRFNASGLLKNNQTSSTLRLTTTGDVYYPQTVTFATELYAPKLSSTKTATDVNGGNLEPGDQIEYAIDVKNDGLDDAVKSELTDAIPTNTSYVPGSLSVGGTPVTDATDGDAGRFVADSNQGQVRANLGTGATGTAGGTVAVSGTTRVVFRVRVDTDLYSDTTIPNSASLSYQGAQTGLVLSSTSNNASAAVTANRADLRVRTTADEAVVQRGDTAAYTVEVVNRGPQTADGVQVAHTLPAGATVASIATDQGTCSPADASCDLGTLPVGTTVTIHLVVKLAANTPDPSTVSSKVSAETIDPNPANDTSSASVGVNAPPTAKDTTATTTDGKATVNVLQNASDPDGDALSVAQAVVQPPAHGTVVVNNDGTLTYTANPGFAGADTITYTVSDGRGGTVTASLSVTVPNTAPVAQDDAFTAAIAGRTDFDVLANDKDANGDKLTVTDVTKPEGGTAVINADGTVGFTPDKGFDGTTTFTYTVADGHGGTAKATVTVTVPNTAPEASDDTASTPYRTPVNIDVLANDKDDNNDPLSIVRGSVSVPTSGGATVGTAVIDNGQIRFTPDDGFSGAATFDYTITDGTSTSTATVTVTVDNGVPVAGDGTVVSDGKRTEIDVLQYASDPNKDPLTITGITGVAHGSVVLNPDGTVTYYTPTPGYKGTDSFDYTVSDGKGGSATGTIDITVKNQPPTAPDVRRTAPSGVPTTIPVLTGAKDPNGDTLSLLEVSQPSHGTLTFDSAKGTITYTPDQGYDGSEVLTFTVSDGDGGTVDATLTIRAVNEPPVVTRDVTSTRAVKGGSVTLDVLANDSDPNGDPLTICGLTTPAGGTAAVADGKLVYTYADDYAGTDVFTYTACDGRGGESTARVIVTVVNDAPVANPDSVTSTRNATATVDVVKNDTDPNGDALELVGVDDPTDAQGNDAGTATVQDGKVVFTPARGFTGTATVPYRVRDGRGAVSTGTLTVTVGNTAPTAEDVTATTPYDTTVSVSPDATDADGDDLSLTDVGAPKDADGVTRGSVTIVDGKAVYDPPAGFSGPVTFGYTVSDGLQSVSATVSVTVGNGAPAITGGTAQTVTATGTPDPITTSDPNDDTVTVTVVDGALPGGLTLIPDGSFTRTGGASKPGTYTFTVEACDDRSPQQCVQQKVTITIDDSAPTAGDASVTTPYDETKTIDVVRTDDNPTGVASDPDGDALTLTDVGQPKDADGTAVGTATIVDGKIVFDPPATFSGEVTFGYTVSDGTKSSSGTVTVTVGNGAPVVTGGTQQTIGARKTPDPITTTDPNGDTVIVTVLSGDVPTGLTLEADGTWDGTATTPGSYTAVVQACDDRNPQQCVKSMVTIVVENTKPVAGDDTVTVDYGTTVTYNVLTPRPPNPNALAYDLDVSDQPTLVAVTDAKDASGEVVGTATSKTDGTIIFVPADGFSGTATIGYTINDDDGYDAKIASGTVTIVVGNGTPTVTSGTSQQIQKSKTPAPLTLSDPNGDKTTVKVVSGRIPTGLTLNPDGTWSGKTTEAGSFVSTVRVCDDRDPAACSTTAVTIAVDDSAPVAADDTTTTRSGTKVTVPVLANDADPDGDPLSITAITDPVDGKGAVVGKATIVGGTIAYVPPVGFRGPVTLTYTVGDGTLTTTATVTITVDDAAPKVTGGTHQTIATGSAPTPIVSSDPNPGDVTSVRVVDGQIPPGLRLDPDGTWSGTATTPGTYVSTVEVCDDQAPPACSTEEVSIRVTAAGGTGAGDGGPSAGGNPVQSVVDAALPDTGASALMTVAGLAGMVLVALGAGLAMRRRREANTEPRSGRRPAGGSRRHGSRRGRRGTGLWLDLRSLVDASGPRPAAAGLVPGRHSGGRHRHG